MKTILYTINDFGDLYWFLFLSITQTLVTETSPPPIGVTFSLYTDRDLTLKDQFYVFDRYDLIKNPFNVGSIFTN